MNHQDTKTPSSLQQLFSGAQDATLSQAVEGFIRLELAGASPATRRWYTSILGELCASFPSARLADLMEGDLRAWAAGLFARKRSSWTIDGHVRAVKRFTKWLLITGLVSMDLGQQIKRPKLAKTTRRGASDQDVERILNAARTNPRDYALLMFLASTGCRRGGAAELRLSDLYLDTADERLQRRAMIREKGEKERTVVMTPETLEALKAWLKVRNEKLDDKVFGLKPSGVSALVRRYCARLGIHGASPHQWRHRLARRLIMAGVELATVSQLLGHDSVAITVRFYGQLQIGQLQDAYDRVNV